LYGNIPYCREMEKRFDLRMDESTKLKAQKKAASLGLSLASYVRMLILKDVSTKKSSSLLKNRPDK